LVEILKTIDDGVDFKVRLTELNEELELLNTSSQTMETD